MANYVENTKANLPHKSQTYSSPFDSHPIYSQIGCWVCDKDTMALKYKLDKNDRTKKADGSPANLTGDDGDVMQKIPAFFMKVTMQSNGKPRFEIDDIIPDKYGSNGKPGFFVHPAFVKKNGEVRPYILDGVYEGYIHNSQLRSISGVLPTTSKTKGQFIDAARQGRNINFSIESIHRWWAQQILMYVEFGTLNIQEAMGSGISNFTWDEGLTTLKDARVTGATNPLGDRSGYVEVGGYSNGKVSVCWRGKENPYGNIFKILGGLIIKDDGYYLTDIHEDMDVTTKMKFIPKDLSMKIPNGYITDMEFPKGFEWTFIPKSTGGSTTTYYCDYFWSHDPGEENIALAGGGWDSGAYCGVAYLSCVYVASDAGAPIGARLSYAAQ